MQRSNVDKANSAEAGKIFQWRVVDFQHGLDIIAWCDDLKDALERKKEYEAEGGESDVFITKYDQTLGRYVMTRYGK